MEELLDRFSSMVKPAENEYVGDDGLLHCTKCHGATQTVVEFLGKQKTVRCVCACVRAEEEREKRRARQEENDRRRKICFSQTNMSSWTFENDDRRNEKVSNAMRRYAERFPQFLREGKGLLLHGTVGTGKTYYAACIANHVIDQGYRALMTNFARLSNEVQGMYEGKQRFIDDLSRYHLLVLDDLGAERKSEFMQEMVFNIVDTRYRSGLPFIVTTNLTGAEISRAQDVSYQRIYDRVLERCHPVEVAGGSRRRAELKKSHDGMNAMLGL